MDEPNGGRCAAEKVASTRQLLLSASDAGSETRCYSELLCSSLTLAVLSSPWRRCPLYQFIFAAALAATILLDLLDDEGVPSAQYPRSFSALVLKAFEMLATTTSSAQRNLSGRHKCVQIGVCSE